MMSARKKTTVDEPLAESRAPTSEPSGEGTFTRYVRALMARAEAVTELAEEAREELRRALVREMRRRSLWSSPPSYVGILGASSWASGDTRTATPLDDLLSECYLFIFGTHLARLANQLRVRSVIDGLVITHLRHFLTDRQKHHDPLGYRLYEILCQAVRGAVEAEDLHVLRGTPKIRNETILGASPQSDPASTAPISDLRPFVARWNDSLLPGIVIAERVARRHITESLQGRLTELEADGITGFRFKDLLDALKEDVRARWSRLHREEVGEVVLEEDDEGVRRLVRILRPETRVEDLDGFKKLVRCVSNLIPGVDARKKTRDYLEKLWNFLRRWSLDVQGESLPSNRALEGELEIPRDRFPSLYETLGQLTRRCQGKLSGAVVEFHSGRSPVKTSTGGRDG